PPRSVQAADVADGRRCCGGGALGVRGLAADVRPGDAGPRPAAQQGARKARGVLDGCRG
ncbi:unnamed protein product, partial [Effrenium voratum]